MILFHDYCVSLDPRAPDAVLTDVAIYVLTPSAVQAVDGLVSRPAALRAALAHLTLPAQATWIEWCAEGMPLALLLCRTEVFPRPAGYGMQISRRPDGTFQVINVDFDFSMEDRPVQMGPNRWLPSVAPSLVASLSHHVEVSVGRFAAAALALIATPRVAELRPTDLGKLNKARARRGKPALRGWSDVYLNLDHVTVSSTPHAADGAGPAGSRKRRHSVAPFLRIRFGRVELVRAHDRGDAHLGRAPRRRFIVTSKPTGSL